MQSFAQFHLSLLLLVCKRLPRLKQAYVSTAVGVADLRLLDHGCGNGWTVLAYVGAVGKRMVYLRHVLHQLLDTAIHLRFSAQIRVLARALHQQMVWLEVRRLEAAFFVLADR